MAGDETHGFDLVIELAERAVRDLLQTIFDNGLLAEILDALPGIDADEADVFTLDLRFDRPTDVAIPANATDTVDISVLLGEGGNRGSMRIVVGVDVDRSGANDAIGLNFEDALHFADVEVLVAGIPIPGLDGPFRNFLRGIGRLNLLPIPVDRGSTQPTTIIAADGRVIDDTSPADRDWFAALATLGGGTAGDRNAFTRHFISDGGTAAIAVGFPWLCRTISPLIDEALELGGAFTNCNLTRTVRIDEDEDVDLTALSIAPADGFIRVSATVKKSGFCYEASGTVAARVKLEIRNGRLIVDSEVEDPDVDVDIPWYCALAAAVIGVIVGGLLFGLIGAIVGGILLPLILWLTTEGIEGVVERAAQEIADAINDLSPSVDVPALVIELLFSDVFIDDITIAGRLRITDNAPIRAEGTVVLPNGSCLDLDSGAVGSRDRLPSVDLSWQGSGFARELRAICGARLARTSIARFDEVTRASLYRGPYSAPNPVPLGELATWFPFGNIFDFLGLDDYLESRRIYGVRTNEGRYAAVTATEVTDTFVRLRYRTYEKRLPTLAIIGGFTCSPGVVVDKGTVTFVPSPALARLAPAQVAVDDVLVPDRQVFERATTAGRCAKPSATADRLTEVVTGAIADRRLVDLEAIPLEHRRVGRWVGTAVGRGGGIGRFTASAQGFGAGLEIRWRVNDKVLDRESGTVDAAGVRLRYSVEGRTVTLTTTSKAPFEFLLGAVATDDAGAVVEAERCVRFEPGCKGEIRVHPGWKDFREVYTAYFGVADLDAPGVDIEVGPLVKATTGTEGRRTSK